MGRTRRNPLYGRQPKVVLVLAVVAAVILAFDFRLEIVLAAVAGLALLVVADNVREVSGR